MSSLSNPGSFRRNPDGKLNITSMMDMFTIILVFLLYSYSTEEQKLTMDDNLKLPESSSSVPYRDTLSVTLSKNGLAVSGEKILDIKDGKIPESQLEGQKITALYDVLIKEKEKRQENPNEKDPNQDTIILFQADKGISFRQINPVMQTTGMAGFPNFKFAVMKKE